MPGASPTSVVGIRSIGIPLPESTKNRDAMRGRFIEVARDLIDKCDAEIIVPMGVTMVPVQYSPAGIGKRTRRAGDGRAQDQHSNRRNDGAHGLDA